MEKKEYKKGLGQNFIYDTNLLRAIVKDAGITNTDEVLEIGVGEGTLTREICKVAKKVVSYEIDTSLEPHIKKNLADITNSEIIYKDFMKESNNEIIKNFSGNFRVVANLPYYITTPIIFKLLQIKEITSITIMVQKEVAHRICSSSGTSDYGILSIMINSVADTNIKRVVKKEMFYPVPKVDSAICDIQLNRTKYNIIDREIFEKVVNISFNPRRKMMISNLKGQLRNITEEQMKEIFSKLGIDCKVRGEVLTIEQFIDLSNMIIQTESENEEKEKKS